METTCINLRSIKHTEAFGITLGRLSNAGDVICLDGDLGSGKTTLTQFVARGLEIPPEFYVTSPSFNVFHEYHGRVPLYHMDFYRLNSSDDVLEMGLDEYFYLSGLTIIEWSEKALDILPDDRLSIRFKAIDECSRQVICSFQEETWQARLTEVTRQLAKRF